MKKTKTNLNDVLRVIGQWEADNDVVFIGSFEEFSDDETVTERIIGFGEKKYIEITLDKLNQLIKEDKTDFINW